MRHWVALLGTVVVCAMTISATGCRSRAKQDVFVQRLTGELRDREDELYDADYANRILSEKYERLLASKKRLERELRGAPPELMPPIALESSPTPIPDLLVDRLNEGEFRYQAPPLSDSLDVPGFDMGNDLGAIDPGEPFNPNEQNPSGQNAGQGIPVETIERGLPERNDATDLRESDFPLPPPSEPEPPGLDDLRFLPIDQGEIIPPPAPDEELEEPAGRVPLPNALRGDQSRLRELRESLVPTALSLHPGFSSAHQFNEGESGDEDQVDGLMLVVNVLDDQGRMMDLAGFDIDADLTIIALFPGQESGEPGIARWEFNPEEVRDLVRSSPVSGLHVPVLWEGDLPDTDEVMIRVLLQSGEDRMTCQGLVDVVRDRQIAKWTPRGESIRSAKQPTNGTLAR